MLQENILVCYAAFVYFISIYLAVLKCVVHYFKLMHLFIVLNRLLFLITHLNAQWNGTTGHY